MIKIMVPKGGGVCVYKISSGMNIFTSYLGSQFSYLESSFSYLESNFPLSKFTSGARDCLGSLDKTTQVRILLYICIGWDFYLRKLASGGKKSASGGRFFTSGVGLNLSISSSGDNGQIVSRRYFSSA